MQFASTYNKIIHYKRKDKEPDKAKKKKTKLNNYKK